MDAQFKQLALDMAKDSPCKKRKVGAIIVDKSANLVMAVGYNSMPLTAGNMTSCEDEQGNTKPEVIHAEVAAIKNYKHKYGSYEDIENCTMYVTHQPCNHCRIEIDQLGIKEVIVVTDSNAPKELTSTLAERQSSHGEFSVSAIGVQALKETLRNSRNWVALSAMQKESLEMIMHKVGRIINGDPNYIDTWHDISGYATLVENYLIKKGETK